MTNQEEMIRLLYELTRSTLKWYIAKGESPSKPEAYQTDYNDVRVTIRRGPYYLFRGTLYQIQFNEATIYESFDLLRLWEAVRKTAKDQGVLAAEEFVADATAKVVQALRGYRQ